MYEEGTSQEILHFSRDEFPLSVVLLFDLTDSVRGVLKRLAEGARTTLEHFKPADEVSVMVYSGHATIVDGFTTDRARTVRAIERAAAMASDEPALFNEAVYQAAVQLRQAGSASNRRVIIWLTDNLPNVPYRKEYPAHTEIEAFRALHEERVVVAPVLLKSPLWAAMNVVVRATEASHAKAFPPGDAHKYAELTGGQAVALRGKRPDERLAQLIDELRAIHHRVPSFGCATCRDVPQDSGGIGPGANPAPERVDGPRAAGLLPQVSGLHIAAMQMF